MCIVVTGRTTNFTQKQTGNIIVYDDEMQQKYFSLPSKTLAFIYEKLKHIKTYNRTTAKTRFLSLKTHCDKKTDLN
ncbi:MAG: hypothetical protein Q8N83_03000 [Ignavibacteria bacterium]|nr:hypothetical protein [Ignavibacteria bacterium]